VERRHFATAQYDRVALAQALLAAAGCDIDRSGPVDRDDDVVVAVGEIAAAARNFRGRRRRFDAAGR
jgi:hypothetical protein